MSPNVQFLFRLKGLFLGRLHSFKRDSFFFFFFVAKIETHSYCCNAIFNFKTMMLLLLYVYKRTTEWISYITSCSLKVIIMKLLTLVSTVTGGRLGFINIVRAFLMIHTTTSSQETMFLGFAVSAAFQTIVQCHPSLLTPTLKARIAFASLPMMTIQTCHLTWICQTSRKPSLLAHQLLKKFLQGKHASIQTRNITESYSHQL